MVRDDTTVKQFQQGLNVTLQTYTIFHQACQEEDLDQPLTLLEKHMTRFAEML